MRALPDMVLFVVEFLSENMPDVWVADALPPDEQLDEYLPCVVVDVLPGREVRDSWGGAGFPVMLDGVSLDLEVFARSRAQATPVAERVRLLMHQLPFIDGSQVTTVECPTFGSREDLNPRVKALGVVAELVTRT